LSAATAQAELLTFRGRAIVLQLALAAAQKLGATHIVLSRVDLAARLEPALRAIVASGIPLAWVAHGSTTLGDLAPATRDWIDRASGQVLAAS
jgi:hypothetical protein